MKFGRKLSFEPYFLGCPWKTWKPSAQSQVFFSCYFTKKTEGMLKTGYFFHGLGGIQRGFSIPVNGCGEQRPSAL